MQKHVHDWLLSLGFETKDFEKGIDKVDKSFSRLNSVQMKFANKYQKALDKQLATLKKQQEVVNKINGKSPIQSFQPQQPKTVTPKNQKYIPGVGHPEENALIKRGLKMDAQRVSDNLSSRFDGDLAKIHEARLGLGKVIAQIDAANTRGTLKKARQDLTDFKARTHVAERAFKKLNNQMSFGDKVAGAFLSSITRFGLGVASIYAMTRAVGSLVTTARQLDAIDATLRASSGSAEQASDDFDFLARVAMDLGTDLKESAKGYAQLAVAGKEAGLTMEEVRELFVASQEGAAAFSLTAPEVFRISKAMTQMLSKGTVMAEELKNQLGDSMPIAVSTMAKAVGVTNKELLKMMERGELIATEVMPKFARELRRASREGGALEAGKTSIGAGMNRLTTAYAELVRSFMDGGGKEGLVEILNALADMMLELKPMFSALGSIVRMLAKAFLFIKPFIELFIDAVSTLASVIGGIAGFLGDWGADTAKPQTRTRSGRSRLPTAPRQHTISTTGDTYTMTVHTGADPKETVDVLQDFMNGVSGSIVPADI